MAEHNFYVTDRELGLIMNKFNHYADMKITLGDFVTELTPKTRPKQ